MPEPVELHFWPTPNGMKISILFEELGWTAVARARPWALPTGAI